MSEEVNNSLEHDELEEPELEEYFNKERTLSLIELFKKYKPLVATGSIKTVKQMWEIVSDNMINLHQISVTPQKCENRFKVLERAYKRTSDIINSGQEPKKIFPYYEEFKTVPRNKKYEFVPGLNSSNYSAYTTVNFSNTITAPICPSATATYIELQNMEQDLTENKETPNSCEKLITTDDPPQCSTQQQVRPSAQQRPPQNIKIGVDIYFNRERTLALIELYKKYNQKYRERGIKTKKRMWNLIAREMTCKFNVPTTGAKCENKLKVLQRNYTRGSYFKRRYEFEEELKELFGERVTKISEKTFKMPRILNNNFTSILNNATTELASNSATPQVTIQVLDPQKTTADKIEAVLSGIRSDFQTYFKERLNIEREKLALKKQKLLFSKDRESYDKRSEK